MKVTDMLGNLLIFISIIGFMLFVGVKMTSLEAEVASLAEELLYARAGIVEVTEIAIGNSVSIVNLVESGSNPVMIDSCTTVKEMKEIFITIDDAAIMFNMHTKMIGSNAENGTILVKAVDGIVKMHLDEWASRNKEFREAMGLD